MRTPIGLMTRSRTMTITFALLTSLVAAPTTFAQVQTAAQQKCIKAMNSAGAKVAASQGTQAVVCLTAALRGKLSLGQTGEQCLSADNGGRVEAARGKTLAAELRACGAITPDFGVADVATINAAAVEEELALIADLFGSPLDAAVDSDKEVSQCQLAIAKAIMNSARLMRKRFGWCTKGVFENALPGSDGSTELNGCVASASVDCHDGRCWNKRDTYVDEQRTQYCSSLGVFAAAFPGACAPVENDAQAVNCVKAATKCRICRERARIAGITPACDYLDDGDGANASCP